MNLNAIILYTVRIASNIFYFAEILFVACMYHMSYMNACFFQTFDRVLLLENKASSDYDLLRYYIDASA